MVPWSYQLAPQKLEQDSPRLPYSFTAIFPLCLLFVIFLLFHQPLTQTTPYYTVSQDDFFPHSLFTSPPNRKQNSLIELSQTSSHSESHWYVTPAWPPGTTFNGLPLSTCQRDFPSDGPYQYINYPHIFNLNFLPGNS